MAQAPSDGSDSRRLDNWLTVLFSLHLASQSDGSLVLGSLMSCTALFSSLNSIPSPAPSRQPRRFGEGTIVTTLMSPGLELSLPGSTPL